MLRTLSLAASAAAFAGLVIGSASAMPLAPATQDGAQAGVILVADGCGIGFHRGPWGGCRPNLSPYWPCHWVGTPWGPRRVCH